MTDVNEETLAKLRQLTDSGSGIFRLKITRRRPGAPFPDHVATLDGATLEHFVAPETWLAKVGGGGLYNVTAYEPNNPNALGKPLQYQIGTPQQAHDFRTDIVRNPDWKGPRGVLYPDPDEQAQIPISTAGSPVVASSAAPPTTASGQPQPGAGFFSGPPHPEVAALQAELRQMRTDRERAEREAEAQRHKAEMERVRADAQLQIKELAAEVKALANKTPEKPALDINGLLTAATPIFSVLLEQSRQSRELQMKMFEESQRATREMMAKIAEKPAIDPLILALIEKKADTGAEHLMAMPKIMSAFSEMASTMADTVNSMNQGDGEPPAVRVAGALANALQTLGQGIIMSNQQKRQPAPQRPQAPQAAQLPPNVHALPPRPNGTPVPTPQVPIPGAPQRQAFAGNFEDAARVPVQREAEFTGPNPLDEVVALVRRGVPAEEVVEYVFSNMNDPRVIAELTEHGTFQQVFSVRVMADQELRDWAFDPRNQPYVVELLNTFNERAAQDPRFGAQPDQGSDPGETGEDDQPIEEEERGEETAS